MADQDQSTDLFGRPLSPHSLDGTVRARMLYAAGDACPARSASRAEFYRAAAQAQRERDIKQAARKHREDRMAAQTSAARERFQRRTISDAAT